MEDLFFGVVIGLIISYMFVYWIGNRISQQLMKEVEDELKNNTNGSIEIKVEKINGVIYGWDADNGDFVCQGATLNELKTHFKSRFPTQAAFITNGTNDILEQLKNENSNSLGPTS